MKLYFKIIALHMIILFSSCNSRVDCNLDLEYKEGLTYFKGKLFSGDCESFYETGIKMNKQTYLNGMDNGKWSFYFKNGNLETEGYFLENKRHGKWTYFFDDGKTVKQISHYNKGKKDSIWVKYNSDKTILWEKNFNGFY